LTKKNREKGSKRAGCKDDKDGTDSETPMAGRERGGTLILGLFGDDLDVFPSNEGSGLKSLGCNGGKGGHVVYVGKRGSVG
jgi:hypothetical protein